MKRVVNLLRNATAANERKDQAAVSEQLSSALRQLAASEKAKPVQQKQARQSSPFAQQRQAFYEQAVTRDRQWWELLKKSTGRGATTP